MTQLPPTGANVPSPRLERPFVPLPIPAGCGHEAWRWGRLVHEHSQRAGAHSTPAAEPGNDVLSHAKGKYGELVFQLWLTQQGFSASHTPFREDYTKKVPEDDFIVNGVRFEIKTKMRGQKSPFPPRLNYNVNLGKKEIENAIHVFIEVSGKTELIEDPEALLVGWAPPQLIAEKGQQTWPGKLSDNGKFTFQRHDWDLAIGDLLPPRDLAPTIARGPSSER